MRNLVDVDAPLVVDDVGVVTPSAPPSWVPIVVGPSECPSRASPP